MGLKIDVALCYQITRGVVEEARRRGNFVRIDIEDSSCTDDTLDVFRRLQEEFPGHVGCALQAYLKRSADDVEDLLPLGPNVRLCKGIYIEPPSIAIKDPEGINTNFISLMTRLLEGGSYLGIATHDEPLVEAACQLVARLGLDRSAYEFQMLLGVKEKLRAEILSRGHRLRVYVPFGSNWHAYSLRRLKENPQIAGHVLRGMLNGRL
jgi:proline dehydrogenase